MADIFEPSSAIARMFHCLANDDFVGGLNRKWSWENDDSQAHPQWPHQGELCKTCKKIKLYKDKVLFENSSALYSSAWRGCPLCQLFFVNDVWFHHKTIDISFREEGLPRSIFHVGAYMFEAFSLRDGRLKPGQEISPRELHPDPASQSCVNVVKNWITSCTAGHSRCKQQGLPVLPTRVIDIRLSKFSEAPFLLETNGRRGHYVALSHCWGIDKPPVTTTTESINFRKKHIFRDTLPKTFRDAIEVTRWLGIEYLWIDSLCIIQDSVEDWEVESSRMGEVYHNSFLTISAMDSPNSHVGFLLPRNIQPSIRLHTHKNVYIRRPVRDWSLALRDAPLNKRAWALQERLLSVRVLHYFKEEIFWECLTCSTRESTAETILTSTKPPTPTLLRDTGDLKQLQFSTAPSPVFRLPALAFWYRTIGEYSGRALTNPTDKLPGILGIASTLGSKLGYTYVCGIWKEDYRNGLLWYSLYSHPALDHGHFDINMGWNSRGIRSPLKKSERAKIKRAPSWSWASMESPVTYTPVEGFLEYPLPSAMAPQLLDITETSITLRAWTRRYQCSLNHRKASDEIYWCSESIHRATHDIDEVKSGVTAYDSESNWDGQERWVVLIHERKKVNKNKYLNPNTGRREEVEMKTFLMIIIIPADNNRWRRVGVLSFKYPILMALRDFERMDITLV